MDLNVNNVIALAAMSATQTITASSSTWSRTDLATTIPVTAHRNGSCPPHRFPSSLSNIERTSASTDAAAIDAFRNHVELSGGRPDSVVHYSSRNVLTDGV